MDAERTNEIVALDREHHLHGYTHFASHDGPRILLERGEGCDLVDAADRRYLDASGGVWCTNIGLGREEMAEAIASQVRTLAYTGPFVPTINRPAAELAATLARLAPGSLNHVFLATGGTTAVETALRMVQFYQRARGTPQKRHIISRRGSYHGSSYWTASISDRSIFGGSTEDFEYVTDHVHHIRYPDYYRGRGEMSEDEFSASLVDEFEQLLLEIGPDRVAAFIAEPIMSRGAFVIPPEVQQRFHALCQQHDVLYVADEVVTGFGRLGHWFACSDVFGFEPDIITSAKGLTSAYLPLGATIYSDEIHRTISETEPRRLFSHAFTYSGHPVCCAAALKNIEIIERESLLEHARQVSRWFLSRLQQLLELPLVGDVRGMGLLACIELVGDEQARTPLPPELGVSTRIFSACLERGLIVRPMGHLIALAPSLVITESQVDFMVETLAAGIRTVADALTREGHL